MKWLNPGAIEGSPAFPDVHSGRIRFDLMDRPNIPCRLRGGAMVVHLDHDPEAAGRKPATITYVKGGKLYSVRAHTVIWAGASFTAKHAVKNLTPEYREAVEKFPRSPMLSVNVALDNWRFLYKLGYSACSWRGGFGFTANLRPNMYVGDYRPPLDPDHPNLFTFYVPFNQYGLSLVEQGHAGRGTTLCDDVPRVRDAGAATDGNALRGRGVRSQARHPGNRDQPVGARVLQRRPGLLHAEERQADAK